MKLATLEVRRPGSPPVLDGAASDLFRAAEESGRMRYVLRARGTVRFVLDPAPGPGSSVHVDGVWRTPSFTTERSWDLPADRPVIEALEPGNYLFDLAVRSSSRVVAGRAACSVVVEAQAIDLPVSLSPAQTCTIEFLVKGVPLPAKSALLRSGLASAGPDESRPVRFEAGSPSSVVLPAEAAWLAGTVEGADGGVFIVDAPLPEGPGAIRVEIDRAPSIRGTVQLPDGSGALGAIVTASCTGGLPRGWKLSYPRTEVGEDGFRLDGLYPGTWKVSAAMRTGGWPMFAGAEKQVALEAGGVGEVNLALAAGRAIEGVVSDSSGRPHEGVKVDALPPGGGFGRDINARGALSDREGRFAIRDLAPGKWDLLATGRSVLPTWLRGCGAGGSAVAFVVETGVSMRLRLTCPPPVQPGDLRISIQRLIRADGTEVDLSSSMAYWSQVPTAEGLVLLEPLPLGGTVHLAINGASLTPGTGLRGRTVVLENCRPGERELRLDEEGAALAGVVVDEAGAAIPFASLAFRFEGVEQDPASTVVCDAAGRFSLAGAPSIQAARVWGSAGDCPGQDLGQVALSGPLRFVMKRGVRVSGLVVDEGGAPISGARVSPVPEGLTLWTDPHGGFEAVFPASSLALIVREGMRVGRAPLPKDGKPLRIRIEKTQAFLLIQVVDREGKPRSGVEIAVEGDNAIGTTDAEGRARIGPLVPGRYRVSVAGADPAETETGSEVRVILR